MSISKTTLCLSLVLTALLSSTSAATAADLVNVAGASGVALNGYDPVAFFTAKKPVNGNVQITAKHRGATYFFASEQHKKMFMGNPDKYAPQCGGYCAFGVAVGALFPVDVNTWQVLDGKLYLNLNPSILKMFNGDLATNVAKAEKNWPELAKKHGKQDTPR